MTPRLRHLAPLVLILAACSAQPVSAPEQSAAAMTEEADAAPSTPALEVIAPGRAATWTQQYTDGTGTTWEVVLDKIECGLTSIPNAKSNPDWMGGPEIPQYVAATPAPGKDFCKAYLIVRARWRFTRCRLGRWAQECCFRRRGWRRSQYSCSKRADAGSRNPGAITPVACYGFLDGRAERQSVTFLKKGSTGSNPVAAQAVWSSGLGR